MHSKLWTILSLCLYWNSRNMAAAAVPLTTTSKSPVTTPKLTTGPIPVDTTTTPYVKSTSRKPATTATARITTVPIPVSTPVPSKCPPNFVNEPGATQCYLATRLKMSPEDGLEECQKGSAQYSLPSVHNQADQTAFLKACMSGEECWLGLSDSGETSGDFHWSDGTPLDYFHWDAGSPRAAGHCVRNSKFNGAWIEADCNEIAYIVCATPKV